MQISRAGQLLTLASAILSAQSTGIDPVWRTKPAAQWTEQEAQQLLTNSPWSREIRAVVSRRLTEDQLREGGQMGQPHGLGFDGVDPKGSGPEVSLNVFTGPGRNDRSPRSFPRGIPLRLCWESALPVRLAELQGHTTGLPTLAGDGYQLAVYGIPGANFKQDPQQLGEPLKKDAVLRREGKKDVKPIRVEAFELQGSMAVVYLFPLSAEISGKDGRVEFQAHIGRIYVANTFELKEMEFLNRLEI